MFRFMTTFASMMGKPWSGHSQNVRPMTRHSWCFYPTHNYVGVYGEYDKRGGLLSNLMVIFPQNLCRMLRRFI